MPLAPPSPAVRPSLWSTVSIRRRRLLLAGAAVAGGSLLARCTRASAARADGAGPAGLLEVCTPWTSGAEANGLLALLADFKGRAPDVTFTEGSAAVDAGAALERRLAAGDPPDSFHCRGGEELAAQVADGRLECLDALFAEQGWEDVLPPALLPRLRVRGGYYAVPAGVRRANLLWSSPAVLDEAGADPAPRSVTELLAGLRRVAAAGLLPLAVGGLQGVAQWLETLLLAALGPQAWTALWQPGADWSGPRVAGALHDLAAVLALAGEVDAGEDWAEATRLVGTDRAGYQLTGDWAEGALRETLGLRPSTGYRWAVAPGTDGVFQCRVDAFTLPRGARHRRAALAWLAECGSLDGQLALNGARGAVPARTGLPESARALFGPYPRWSLEQWDGGRPLDSLAHGGLLGAGRRAAVDEALKAFLAHRDPARLGTDLAGGA
ncbi:ABC transporter substrate-binding protein [Kitasatospora paracochleata]